MGSEFIVMDVLHQVLDLNLGQLTMHTSGGNEEFLVTDSTLPGYKDLIKAMTPAHQQLIEVAEHSKHKTGYVITSACPSSDVYYRDNIPFLLYPQECSIQLHPQSAFSCSRPPETRQRSHWKSL